MSDAIIYEAGKVALAVLGAGGAGSLLTIWLGRGKFRADTRRAEAEADNVLIDQLREEVERLQARVKQLETYAAVVHRAQWERDQAVAERNAANQQLANMRELEANARKDRDRYREDVERLLAEFKRTDDLTKRLTDPPKKGS